MAVAAADTPTATQAAARRVWVERGIYRQPNGRYAVCVAQAGCVWFRTIGTDLDAARAARRDLAEAARRRELPLSPRTRLDTVAGRWLERFVGMVAAGDRRQRTLDAHRYHLDRHILPLLDRRRISSLTLEDIVAWLTALRGQSCSEKTRARWRRCTQSCATPAGRAGSSRTLPRVWSAMSARDPCRAHSAQSAASRSPHCSTPACQAAG